MREKKPSGKKKLTSRAPKKTTVPELRTTLAEPADRVMRYRKNPRCPNCDAHPVICTARVKEKSYFRCRQCGHRFEVGR